MGSTSTDVNRAALNVIGATVSLPSQSLGGHVIPRGRLILYTLDCGGCVNTEVLLRHFSQAPLLPVVVVAATEERYVPSELLARPDLAVVVTDMTGLVVPINMLKRAPQAALLDESGNIERLWNPKDQLDEFLRAAR